MNFIAETVIICRQMILNIQSDELVYKHSFLEEKKIFIIALSFSLWPMHQRVAFRELIKTFLHLQMSPEERVNPMTQIYLCHWISRPMAFSPCIISRTPRTITPASSPL